MLRLASVDTFSFSLCLSFLRKLKDALKFLFSFSFSLFFSLSLPSPLRKPVLTRFNNLKACSFAPVISGIREGKGRGGGGGGLLLAPEDNDRERETMVALPRVGGGMGSFFEEGWERVGERDCALARSLLEEGKLFPCLFLTIRGNFRGC